MPPPNHFAGFFNLALRQRLEQKFGEHQTKALLRQLSLFQITSNIPQTRTANVPSEVAVLHNMLTRGLPTIPSLFVEEKMRDLLGLITSKEEQGSISFGLLRDDETFVKDIFTALHIVDKRLDDDIVREKYPRIEELGSDFEKQVFFDQTAKCRYLYQLLEPQVTLEKITGGTTHLANQRVDFGFTTPYFEEAQVRGLKKSDYAGSFSKRMGLIMHNLRTYCWINAVMPRPNATLGKHYVHQISAGLLLHSKKLQNTNLSNAQRIILPKTSKATGSMSSNSPSPPSPSPGCKKSYSMPCLPVTCRSKKSSGKS